MEVVVFTAGFFLGTISTDLLSSFLSSGVMTRSTAGVSGAFPAFFREGVAALGLEPPVSVEGDADAVD